MGLRVEIVVAEESYHVSSERFTSKTAPYSLMLCTR